MIDEEEQKIYETSLNIKNLRNLSPLDKENM